MERQLWGVKRDGEVTGVLVTEVYTTSRGLVCWVWAACGSETVHEMRRLYEAIREWARALGCVSIGIQGRKGWKRVLPSMKETAVVLEEELCSLSPQK